MQLHKNESIRHFFRSSTKSSKNNVEHIPLTNSPSIKLSLGEYAKLADGQVVATLGDTSVMVTAVSKTAQATSNIPLPLSVNYKQKAAAVGRIPTNYFRRDLGMSEHEILGSRKIDRAIRPLFPEGYNYDTQIVANVMAIDNIYHPDTLAINATSVVLHLSDIPWNGPIGAVRLGMIDNEIILNPTKEHSDKSKLDLVLVGTNNQLIVMIEASASEISEPKLVKALKVGIVETQAIVQSIINLRENYGRPKRVFESNLSEVNDLAKTLEPVVAPQLRDIFTNYNHDKLSRDRAVDNVRSTTMEVTLSEHPELSAGVFNAAFLQVTKQIYRELIFDTNKRCDGRSLNDLRDIKCKVKIFNPLHGSSVFQRGQTQVLCTVTLDSIESTLKLDTVSMLASGIKEKNFFLHYEFPPFATNETGKIGTIGRREIGHGALAEKALKTVIPKNYPFTIRLTSEVLESNGSSSMATVCGGSLALMDAGVNISNPVSGVAIGLVGNYKYSNPVNVVKEYRILSDILGMEDFLGDIDFKIAATMQGITAIQADVKVPGLPKNVIANIITHGVQRNKEILAIMQETLAKPRTDKENMPVIEVLNIPIHQRGKFRGPGGSNFKKILVDTGVNIHQQEDDTYSVFAPNATAMATAKKMIENILQKEAEPEFVFGGVYTAKIVEIRSVGLMVSLHPNLHPVLLPLSQLDTRKVLHPSALGFSVGQEIQVKYFGRDPASGGIRISRKVLQEPIDFMKSFFSHVDK